MSEQALINIGISNILFACQQIERTGGYSYRFDLSTSIDELVITIYHHTPGESIKRVAHRDLIDLKNPDVMEDFKAVEQMLLSISRKKASV